MNSPTITMEKEQALYKLEQYEDAARKNPRLQTDTDRRIAQGYKVLAKGGRLVDVNAAMRAGGLNLAGIPKLAITRAHTESVAWRPNATIGRGWKSSTFSVSTNGGPTTGGGLYEYARDTSGWRDHRIGDDRAFWQVPAGTYDAGKVQRKDFRAMTPHVPLPHRPRHKLENYFILFEANWSPTPPVDPYLLRPVTGSLMEIIAEWDLTPLELAAVSGAMRNR